MSVTRPLFSPPTGRLARAPKFGFLYASLVVLGLLFSQGALAFSTACNENIKAMCTDVSPGAYRLTICLLANSSKLAHSCRPEVFASIQRSPDFIKGCSRDVAALCPKVSATHGRVYSCLMQQESELSAECKAQVKPILMR